MTYKPIKRLFNKLGCPALVILKTPIAGQEVDNGCGLEFELPEWAVIHDGEMSEKASTKYYEWTMKRDVDINRFDADGCTTLDDLIKELHDRDGYEVVYKRKEV